MTELKMRKQRIGPLFAVRIADWLRDIPPSAYARTREQWEADLLAATGIDAGFANMLKIAEEVHAELPLVRGGRSAAEQVLPELIAATHALLFFETVSPSDIERLRLIRALDRAERSLEKPKKDAPPTAPAIPVNPSEIPF